MYEILSKGEKVRMLRKEFKLKQKDICGNKTRNLICNIENGRTNLIEETAIMILEEIKVYVDKNNVNINETLSKLGVNELNIEYLMETDEVQAKRVVNNLISLLNNMKISTNPDVETFIKYCDKTTEIVNEYKFDNEELKLYEISSDYFYKVAHYDKSEIYAKLGINKSKTIKNEEKKCIFMIKISRSFAHDRDYKMSYKLLQCALYTLTKNNINNLEIKHKIYYDNALISKKLNKIKECLEWINLYEQEFGINLNSDLDLISLKALCLENLNYKDKAELLYNESLEKLSSYSNNFEMLSIMYNNRAEFYFNQEKYNNALDDVNTSIRIIENNNITEGYINEIQYLKCKILRKLNNLLNYEEGLLDILRTNNKSLNKELALNVIKELVGFYISKNRTNSLKKIIMRIEELNLDGNKYIKDVTHIIFKYLYYISEENNLDIVNIREFIKLGLNLTL